MENKNYKNILLFKLIERSREERKTYKANRAKSRGAISINKSRKS